MSLLTSAMGHWNTNYLDKAIQHLGTQGVSIPDELLAHVAPLGWENIALTGDYNWSTSKPSQELRSPRTVPEEFTPARLIPKLLARDSGGLPDAVTI